MAVCLPPTLCLWCCLRAVWRPVVRGGGGAVCRPVPEGAPVLQQSCGWQQEPGLCHPLSHHEIQLQQCQRKHMRAHMQNGAPHTHVLSKCSCLYLLKMHMCVETHSQNRSDARVPHRWHCSWHLSLQKKLHLHQNIFNLGARKNQNSLLYFLLKTHWCREPLRSLSYLLCSSFSCSALMSFPCLFWACCRKFLLKDVSISRDQSNMSLPALPCSYPSLTNDSRPLCMCVLQYILYVCANVQVFVPQRHRGKEFERSWRGEDPDGDRSGGAVIEENEKYKTKEKQVWQEGR